MGQLTTSEDLLNQDAQHVWHPYGGFPASTAPLPVVGARGVELTLADGRTLVDGMSSWWAAIHGYRNPHLDAAYHTTAERLRGYRVGAGAARLRLHECPHNTPESGAAQAHALLAAHPEVSALLCMSDVLAQGACQAARALGRRIPQDLSIIGYDDVPLSAALDLSTVQQPTAEKGRRAGEALLAQLAGKVPASAALHPLPTRLVLRGSTAEREAAGGELEGGRQRAEG